MPESDDHERQNERPPRTGAEWTTFVVCLAILLALISAIAVEAVRHDEDANPVADVQKVAQVGERFHVTVEVENRGDRAAEAVQVLASLEIDGETTEGDQTIDFLSGGDTEELVFVFEDDPDDAKLSVEVTGFTVP